MAGGEVTLKVGRGVGRSDLKCIVDVGRNAGMTPGPVSKLHLTPASLGTLAGLGPLSKHQALSCCSNKFFQGVALGGGAGHTQLPAVGMRQLQGLLPRPTKRQAEESEQLIVAPGPPPGAPGLHPRDLANASPTPNTGSPGWASSVAASPATQPGAGGELKMLHLEGI